MAAILAGMSYGTESAGAVHAMSQTAGGVYNSLISGWSAPSSGTYYLKVEGYSTRTCDYEVIARMDGYETLQSHHLLKSPWYQWPGLDLFSESLYPGWIHDEREVEFALVPEAERDQQELLEDAREFRERTLFSED